MKGVSSIDTTFGAAVAVFTTLCCSTTVVTIDDLGEPSSDPDSASTDSDDTDIKGLIHTYLEETIIGYSGVDILIVVDNSSGMAAAQQKLSTEIQFLVDNLGNPYLDLGTVIENIRIAVTTAELGLSPNDVPIEGCFNAPKEGHFVTSPCPSTEGLCVDASASCVFAEAANWLETSEDLFHPSLATEVSCLVKQGTTGCPVQQPLEAALTALRDNPEFVKDEHLLAVIVVSDKEDCSIEDSRLFSTEAWVSSAPDSDGLACHFPPQNREYLFRSAQYFDRLVSLKDGRQDAVVFAAIVGVPADAASCNGSGDSLENCLFEPEMLLDTGDSTACTAGPTIAFPGRRYVELAERFGANGYVQSICSTNYGAVSDHIQNIVRTAVKFKRCYGRDGLLEFEDASYAGCPDCVSPVCDLFIEIVLTSGQDTEAQCPTELTESPDFLFEEVTRSQSQSPPTLLCPVPKLRVEEYQSCEGTFNDSISKRVGWYSCQHIQITEAERSEIICSDGIDNDGNGLTDCGDGNCSACVKCAGQGCSLGCSTYEIVLTDRAAQAAEGHRLLLSCPY
jgi:hypothetical protein